MICGCKCRDDPQPPARQEVDAGKFAELAQAELARVRATRHVLLGAAQVRNGLQIDVSTVLEVNLLQPDIPQPLQSKFDKKVELLNPSYSAPLQPARALTALYILFSLKQSTGTASFNDMTLTQPPTPFPSYRCLVQHVCMHGDLV